jgi:membrane fusion protein
MVAMSKPTPGLFRPEALKHLHRSEEGHGLILVSPPWTWALLLVLLSGVGTALVASVLGRVEVNARARAILRPSAGVRTLVAKIDGTVGRVEVRSGQAVQAGTALLRIEAPPVQAQRLEAARHLESIRKHYKVTASLQDQGYAEQARRLAARIRRLKARMASQENSLRTLERNLQRNAVLEGEGILPPAKADEAREALAQAQRQLGEMEEALEHACQEQATLAFGRQDGLWQRRQTIESAEIREEALAFALQQTLVAAPEDGVVEAMLVKPGELVQAGQALCKLIPQTSPLHGVAFLEEKDRAFVRQGDVVPLELDQLPYAEYGTVLAKVERISSDLASPFEIREAFGDGPLPGGPTFRVELRITEAKATARAGVPLRSGMMMNARFTLRRQRLLTLVLDPLRKWLR